MKLKRIMRDIDDDIDDLFRRAADNYPLNTNSSDWSKVQNALQSSEDAAVQNVKSKKKYRRFLWLLLLLPFTFLIEKYAFQNQDKSKGISQHQTVSPEQKSISSPKNDMGPLNKEEETKAGKQGTNPASLKNKKGPSPASGIIQNKNGEEILNRVNEGKNIQDKYSPKPNVVAGKDILAEQEDNE